MGTGEQPGLTGLLTAERFARIERVFRRHFQLGLETTGPDGQRIESLCSGDCEGEFCRLVRSGQEGRSRCIAERRRAVEIAAETGQSFITVCHAGVVLVCVPVVDRDTVHGGVFFGKCLWEPVTEIVTADIERRVQDLVVGQDGIVRAMKTLPVVRGRQIHRAAEFLFDLLYEVGGFDARVIRWRRQRAEQQSEIGEFIQERKKLGAKWQYPLESERALLQKVKIGDRTGAKEILNSILGTILFKDIGDLGILKVRLLELLTVLSRSAVEGGVDVDVMLERNLAYVNKVMQINNQEDLCAWISAALNEFLELVYSSQDSRKITQITPAINYIDANYDKPITLAEIAKASHLSASRLAHIFKEQMGITLIDYLTSVRIEQAKELLLATDQSCTEICFQVGYNNQSYFTRTFKAVAGLTPRQFRIQNRRDILSRRT
ncbi:MAG: helix-turn-helix domain-containing protein [Sedimentisphaerales bacterium]|nr:helix-turn-helix domain-containing protein [Sedimentisphaerales bacterium]